MKIAFLTTGSDNYFSVEYGLHGAALPTLELLAEEMGFHLLNISQEIRTEEHFHAVSGQLRDADLILLQCGGFTDGNLVPHFGKLGIPMCIWAVNEPRSDGDIQLHSLVTQNLFFSILKKHCRSGLRLYALNGESDMRDCLAAFRDVLAVEKLLKTLWGARICQIGREAPGFLNLQEDEESLRESFGISIDHMEVSELVSRSKAADPQLVSDTLEVILRGCRCEINSRDALERSVRLYLALRSIAEEGYLGLAVSCWPELQDDYHMVPCAAFSWLLEYDDVPIACEGDVGGLLSMIILQQLSGEKPTLLDLTQFDREHDALLFWHCGFSPASLAADECSLIRHPMLNRRASDDKRVGVSQDFYFHKGTATILRVTGNGHALFFLEAKSTDRVTKGFLGTRSWFTDFRSGGKALSSEQILRSIMANGIEHHYALVFGQVSKRIELFASTNNYEVVNLL